MLWQAEGLAAGDGLGAGLRACPDLDGDGARDLVAGAPGEDGVGGGSNHGYLRVLAGASGAFLSEVAGTGGSERFGRVIALHEDGDYDLLPDLFAGTQTSSGGNEMRRVSIDPVSLVSTAVAGDSLVGTLADFEDRDGVRMEVMTGEELSFTVKGSKLDGVVLAVLDEDGAVLLSSDPGSPAFDALAVKAGKKSLVASFVAAELGVVNVLIGRPDGNGSLKYTLATKRTSSSSPAVQLAIPFAAPDEPLAIPFEATAGAKLSGSVSVAPNTIDLAAVDLVAPDDESLAALLAQGAVVSKKGDKITFQSQKLPLPQSGDYELAIEPTPGSSGTLTVNLKLKLLKGKTQIKE
jgi:hypothetical protein